MKRQFLAVAVVVAALATASAFSSAMADGGEESNTEHTFKGGLGFRSSVAPIGFRWWLNHQVAIDAGVGFTSEKLNYLDFNDQPADENFSTVSVDVGVPIALKRWPGVHFIFRPGFTWSQSDDIDTFLLLSDTVPDPQKYQITDYTVTGELELEVFIVKNASFSAAHGVGYASQKHELDTDANTLFGTFGNNFTTLGFHVYLFGGE